MFGPISSGVFGIAGLVLAISILGSRKSKDSIRATSNPTVLDRTVSEETARALQEELRVLTVRLESLGSLVQKLKASHEQGYITDEEFKSLAAKHMDDISQLEQEIVRRRLVIELFELEEIEGKLARAFTTKIAELNDTIRLIRRKLGLEQTEGGETISMPTLPATQIQSAPSTVNAPTKTAVPQTADTTRTADTTPTESAPKAPESIEIKPSQKPSKRATGGQETKEAAEGDETKERDVEEELSRIRTDVEKLLDELEQMEQPHG